MPYLSLHLSPRLALLTFCTLTSALPGASLLAARAQEAAPPTASPAPAAAAPATAAPATAAPASDPLFSGATTLYDTALRERVDKEGRIDYAKLKGDANLAAFVAALPSADVSKFPVFPIKEDAEDAEKNRVAGRRDNDDKPKLDRSWELAFWINAHNALVLKTLADAYPIASPDEVKDLATRKFAVAGGQYALADLRGKAVAIDRRAPFAMIDGTLGGPKMAPRAMRAFGLSDTLESAVSAVVNDPRLVDLQRIENRVAVAPFLGTVEEAWRPRTARRKYDGIRNLLSLYTDARPSRNYYTTNEYQVLLANPNRKINAVPSAIAG